MSLSREQMLVEMGVSPLWVIREAGTQHKPVDEKPSVVAVLQAEKQSNSPFVQPAVATEPLSTMAQTPATPRSNVLAAEKMSLPAVDTLNWSELAEQVSSCKACSLCEHRKQAVFGVGDLNPDWLFIGEGTGTEEDTQGEPFVGQAGQLLDNMLAALDLGRGNKVYIVNAVKCRPPGNRTPEAAEINICRPYLARQIALLKPKIIVLLGKVAAHSLLHEDKTLASMRGTCFEFAGIPVVVTYHPTYLLRNLPDKAKAWEDLVLARQLLRQHALPELPF